MRVASILAFLCLGPAHAFVLVRPFPLTYHPSARISVASTDAEAAANPASTTTAPPTKKLIPIFDGHVPLASPPASLVRGPDGNEEIRRRFEAMCRQRQDEICAAIEVCIGGR